jgi:hypothetical protein
MEARTRPFHPCLDARMCVVSPVCRPRKDFSPARCRL